MSPVFLNGSFGCSDPDDTAFVSNGVDVGVDAVCVSSSAVGVDPRRNDADVDVNIDEAWEEPVDTIRCGTIGVNAPAC